MKLVWSILPLVSLCLTASATQNPSGFLDTLNLTPSIEDFRASNADVCADFTGDWKGSCMASGVKKDEAFTVKQTGCVAIEVSDGKHKHMMPIGGVFGVTGAVPGTPAITFGGNIETHWNADKTILNVRAMGGMKKLDIAAAPMGGMFSNQLHLKDGKLYADVYAFGSTRTVAFCEFIKQ